jgi:hypothetical protein
MKTKRGNDGSAIAEKQSKSTGQASVEAPHV